MTTSIDDRYTSRYKTTKSNFGFETDHITEIELEILYERPTGSEIIGRASFLHIDVHSAERDGYRAWTLFDNHISIPCLVQQHLYKDGVRRERFEEIPKCPTVTNHNVFYIDSFKIATAHRGKELMKHFLNESIQQYAKDTSLITMIAYPQPSTDSFTEPQNQTEYEPSKKDFERLTRHYEKFGFTHINKEEFQRAGKGEFPACLLAMINEPMPNKPPRLPHM